MGLIHLSADKQAVDVKEITHFLCVQERLSTTSLPGAPWC